MEDREKRHQELNDLVTMAEACLLACLQVEGGNPAQVLGATRNRYAGLLAKCLTVYALSEDRKRVRPLDAEEIQRGTFRDGGREIFFTDGRETIANLAVKRAALKAAIEVLKRASSGTRSREVE